MRNRNVCCLVWSLCLAIGWQAAPAVGAIVVPGADGSDGVLTVVAGTTYVIDLSLAPTGTWDGINASPGNGVYDKDMFAVVFRYSSVNIPAASGTIVQFKNHPTRAPVVWLVGGDVNIDPDAGNVTIDGIVILRAVGNGTGPGEPGPGGFRGGSVDPAGLLDGAGFGPGGGPLIGSSGHGSYGSLAANESTTYGNARILPLIGGSGGAAMSSSGTGGGGAILIAATRTITLSNTSSARGIFAELVGISGSSDGSGGAIRLIADVVTGAAGVLRAQGVGDGRISIEAVTTSLVDTGNPNANLIQLMTNDTAQIWPDPMANPPPPTVRAVSLGASLVPSDPQASLDFPNADITISDPSPLTLTIETQNVPIPTDPLPWVVNVRVVPKNGQDFIVPATFVSGTTALSTWTAPMIPLPNGFSAIQVRASAQ